MLQVEKGFIKGIIKHLTTVTFMVDEKMYPCRFMQHDILLLIAYTLLGLLCKYNWVQS